jgi:hypothetical protein
MDEETLTVWLDTALLMLGGFVLMTVLMMTVVNPPAKSAEKEGDQVPGNVVIEAQWQDRLDADVDLWVEAPGDMPVGYSNKNGRVFNLLRDDLGMAQDMTDVNYEIAYSRGMPAGEYVVNVHLYRVIGSTGPIEVRLVASRRTDEAGQTQQLASTTVRLLHLNDQVTAFRFDLDGDGNLVPGSMNTLFKELRVASQ